MSLPSRRPQARRDQSPLAPLPFTMSVFPSMLLPLSDIAFSRALTLCAREREQKLEHPCHGQSAEMGTCWPVPMSVEVHTHPRHRGLVWRAPLLKGKRNQQRKRRARGCRLGDHTQRTQACTTTKSSSAIAEGRASSNVPWLPPRHPRLGNRAARRHSLNSSPVSNFLRHRRLSREADLRPAVLPLLLPAGRLPASAACARTLLHLSQ